MSNKFSSFSPVPCPQNIEEIIEWTKEQLRANFTEHFPEEDYDKYVSNFFDELDKHPDITPVTHITYFQMEMSGVKDARVVAEARIKSSIKASLNYCYVALKASREQDQATTQFCTAQAALFSGLTRGYALGVYWADDVDSLLQMAKSGGRKRSEKYQPLRQFVLDEVSKRKFRSKRHAALSLKDDVLKLAKDLEIFLSEPQAEKTISGWLEGSTFASKGSR